MVTRLGRVLAHKKIDRRTPVTLDPTEVQLRVTRPRLRSGETHVNHVREVLQP